MRVALCLSGMPRSFKRCADSLFKNFIDIHTPDIFISTWKSELVDDAFPETDTVEELLDIYNPIKFDVEIFNQRRQATFESNPFKGLSDQGGRSVGRMLPMFYKIYLADLHRFVYEKEHQFTYDVVVRCRMDLLFDGPVPIEQPIPNVVYFPIKNSTSHVNDQFWYGDSATATQMCALYYFVPQLWHAGVFIHGEALVYAYVVAKQFTIKPVEINYEILR